MWCIERNYLLVRGGNTNYTKLIHQETTLSYLPDDFKSKCKVEEGCKEGHPERKLMQLEKNKSKITLTSWIDALGTYLE